jgi:hypothetical protein
MKSNILIKDEYFLFQWDKKPDIVQPQQSEVTVGQSPEFQHHIFRV